MWPKTQIYGNSEIAVARVGEITPGVAHISKMRTKFQDLSTNDKLIVDLDPGNSVTNSDPVLTLKEEHDGVETILGTFTLPSADISIDWQIKFLDEGVSKFYYKTNTGPAILLWSGDLTADLAECKVVHEFLTNESSPTRSVKTDFIWIFYKSIYTGFDIEPENRYLANISIFDQNKTETESEWLRVYSKDHKFVGDRVVDNGIVRIRFKSTPEIEVYGWKDEWVLIGSILPENSQGSIANTLLDVIFNSFNDSSVVITAKFGIMDYRITMRKGMPYARFRLNSKQFTFNTTKERFAMSSTESTKLSDYNQFNSHQPNRGNPLGLATPEMISRFTEDIETNRGLGHVDDNWFAVYNNREEDLVGWMGSMFIPVDMEVESTDRRSLSQIRMRFRQENAIAVGVLDSSPTQIIGGLPAMFFPGKDDSYVKWRANASTFDLAQSPFVRKRR